MNGFKLQLHSSVSRCGLVGVDLAVKRAQMPLSCGERLNVLSWNDRLPEAAITGRGRGTCEITAPNENNCFSSSLWRLNSHFHKHWEFYKRPVHTKIHNYIDNYWYSCAVDSDIILDIERLLKLYSYCPAWTFSLLRIRKNQSGKHTFWLRFSNSLDSGVFVSYLFHMLYLSNIAQTGELFSANCKCEIDFMQQFNKQG